MDNDNHEIVEWHENGTMFIIKEQGRFLKEIIPKYFQHVKFASFARQLNFYGFRKIVNKPVKISDLTGSEANHISYLHPFFQRDREDLLAKVERSTKGASSNIKKRQYDALKQLDILTSPSSLPDPKLYVTREEYEALSKRLEATEHRLSLLDRSFQVLYNENKNNNNNNNNNSVRSAFDEFIDYYAQKRIMGDRNIMPIMIPNPGQHFYERPNNILIPVGHAPLLPTVVPSNISPQDHLISKNQRATNKKQRSQETPGADISFESLKNSPGKGTFQEPTTAVMNYASKQQPPSDKIERNAHNEEGDPLNNSLGSLSVSNSQSNSDQSSLHMSQNFNQSNLSMSTDILNESKFNMSLNSDLFNQSGMNCLLHALESKGKLPDNNIQMNDK
jgi:hypothetical protein